MQTILTEKDLANIEAKVYEKDKVPYFSNSRLETINQCSLKYYFNYVRKLRFDVKDPARCLGSVIHKVFEFYFKSVWAGKEVDSNDCHFLFDQLWTAEEAEIMKHRKDLDKDKCSKSKYMGIKLVSEYYKYLRAHPKVPITYIMPITKNKIPAVELEVRVPIINLKTGKLISDKYELLGHIDLIATSKQGITIEDHKTASRKYSNFKCKTSLQLLIYSYFYRYLQREKLLESLDGKELKPKESLVGFNVMLKGKIPSIEALFSKVGDGDLDRLYYVIENAIRLIENKIYLPSNSQVCNMCDYNMFKESICLDWQKDMTVLDDPIKFNKIVKSMRYNYGVELNTNA